MMTRDRKDQPFIEKVDSISTRFLASLFTGRPDPLFGEIEESDCRESEVKIDDERADSQRGARSRYRSKFSE